MVRVFLLAALALFSPEIPARAEQAAPVAPGVVSTGILPRSPGTNEDIVIVTPADGDRRLMFREREKAATTPPPLPLFVSLLDLGSPHPFGADQRCEIEQIGVRVRVRCRPGASISGARLVFGGFRLPSGAAVDLHVQAAGSPGFTAEVTAEGADAISLQAIQSGGTQLRLPALADTPPPQLVIMAPREGGVLDLTRLELSTRRSRPAVSALSAWAWEPALWRGDSQPLISSALQRNIGRLFITLDVQDGKVSHERELRRFVRMAAAAGVQIEAVEGDPRMVLQHGLENALVRARAFADYQQGAGKNEKLAGIQYDIEPYVLAEWGEAPADYQGWGDAILELSRASGEPIDLVLPFWLSGQEGGRNFLDRIKPAIRGLTIMSYRTRSSSLSQIAEPLLSWGTRQGKPVRLALEAGPIADEVEQVYREAPVGTLALLPGPEPKILILEKPSAIEGARMFELHGRETVRGDRISFLGDEGQMLDMARLTAPVFSAWPSFAGFALHGLQWPISEGRSTAVR